MSHTHGFAWILWISLSSGLFLYNNNHNLFKSLIQNHFCHQSTYCHIYCIICIICILLYYQLINSFSHASIKVWFHLVPCDVQPSWVTILGHKWSLVVTNYDQSNLSSIKSASLNPLEKSVIYTSTCLS